MTTRRAICTACAPASLERSPPLPLAHRQGISAIHQCQSGHDGPSLSPCHSGGEPHRGHPACGTRHCPQGPQPKTPQWLQHPLDQQLPGPHGLMPFPVPETLRPFRRSQHRLASQARFPASSRALTRLATDARFLGTALPGGTGVLHTWGRQLQAPPHRHSMVPGGGLAADRTPWRPSRTTCFVPVKALAPLSRALCNDEMRPAGLREPSAPDVWTIPWNVHRQAHPHGHAACPSLAPYGVRVALAHRRRVGLTDRTVPVP